MLYEIFAGARRAGRRCLAVLHPETFVVVGFAVVLAVSAVAVGQSTEATRRAEAASRRAQAAVVAIDKKFCDAAVPSWNIRNQLILDSTTPSKLSAEVQPDSPEGKALAAQVRASNERKAAQRERDLKLNGERPC